MVEFCDSFSPFSYLIFLLQQRFPNVIKLSETFSLKAEHAHPRCSEDSREPSTPLWDESPVCENCLLCALLSSLSWLGLGDFFEITQSLKCYCQGQLFLQNWSTWWLLTITHDEEISPKSLQPLGCFSILCAHFLFLFPLSKTRVQRQHYKLLFPYSGCLT